MDTAAGVKGLSTLWDKLTSFENLYQAATEARSGKRFKDEVARFHHDVGANLVALRDELLGGHYRPGPYRTFTIYEPAKRFISAAPYRDRVVHHALCRTIEPLFERSFIFDSYANRKGKGTHRALDRCTEYCRRFEYVFEGDVKLFFPSIDHEILLDRLARRIFDSRVMALARAIVEHSNPQPPSIAYFPGDDLFTPFDRRRGLPIGNLTSQFWANVYLDPLDHHFRDELGVPGYIRYVDDFLIFSNDKALLTAWRDEAEAKLAGLRLRLHERKRRIFPVAEGIPFLGFRVYAQDRRLLPASVTRARRRLVRMAEEYERGEKSMDAVRRSVCAWIAHASHGNTTGLRRRLFQDAVFRAGGQQCGAGRLDRRTVTTTSAFVAPVYYQLSLFWGGGGGKAALLRKAAVCFGNVQTAGPAPA
ncbi:MAG: reverse transcriptase/maturase family protein [Bryobacteraceae bacterium]|nr:reverse transcriptase/maturase family protein [Bryobacteraceae bacterium]